jgi:hypothetical protein
MRAKDETVFRSTAKQLFMDEETKGSAFADPDAISSFTTALNTAIEERLEAHQGSDASKMVLRADLENVRGQLTDSAATRGLQAQRKQVGNLIQERFADHTMIATREPMLAASVIDDVPNVIAKFADVLTPDEVTDFEKAGKEQITLGVLDTFMARGQVKEADELLSAASSYMSPEAGRQYRNRILVTQAKKQELDATVQSRLNTLTSMGVDVKSLSPTQKLAIADINVPSEPNRTQTLSGKIAEFESTMAIAAGKPYKATEEDIRRFSNIEDKAKTSKSTFGNSLQGLSAVRANELVSGFANNHLGAEEDIEFITAMQFLSAPNPISGEPTPLSPVYRAALQRRGMNPDDLSGSTLSRKQAARFFDEPQAVTPDAASTQEPVGGEATADAVPVKPEAPAQPAEAQLDPSGQLGQITSQAESFVEQHKATGVFGKNVPDPPITLFNLSDKLTGPISSFQQGASGVAGLDAVVNAPEVRQARRFFETFKLDLARSLQNNPKFPVSELNRVFESLNLESSFIGSPEAFRQDLIGLSEFLEQKADGLQQTVAKGNVSREERRHSADALNLIQRALRVIGAPPKFETPELARESVRKGELSPGAFFRLPDQSIPGGKLMRVKPVGGQ